MAEKKVLRALIIEDDPFFVAVMEDYCHKMVDIELQLHHTVTLEDSLDYLDKHRDVEIIILDYLLLDKLTGLVVLQHIRAKGIKVPVIVVTGRGDEEIAVLMMKAGASDYRIKGHLTPELIEESIKDALVQQERFHGVIEKERQFILKDMAIKSSLNGVCIMNPQGIISYLNPSFVDMWEYPSDQEIIGKRFQDFFSPPERIDEIFVYLQTKKSWMGELVARKKDGTLFYLQALFSLINYTFEGEETPQVMTSFIDVTKAKDSEKKREALYRGIMEVFAMRAEEVGNIETAGHIHRIAAYTRFIAEKLRECENYKGYIDEKYINDISYASMLHDVGKWRTPNEILLKPSQLTRSEREVIEKHPKLGAEMLMPLLKDKGSNQYLKLVESVVLYHHEKWDGTGYPEQLKGEEIPLSARIVALADVYDALTSDRSYRKALSHEEAYRIMEKDKLSYDPRIWQIFENNQPEFCRIRDAKIE
jgi:PAS domain S-box-containing protein